VNLGQFVEAWDSLQKALRYGQGPLSDRLYAQARTHEKLLRQTLATIEVRCAEPGAEVTLDGQTLFSAPGKARRVVVSGSHQVVARKEGFITRTLDQELMPGDEAVVDIQLIALEKAVRTERRWHVALPWSVLGAGVAIGVAGVPLIVQARDDFGRYDDEFAVACPDGCMKSDIPGRVRDIHDRAKAEYYSSIAMFAVGGAAIATGVLLVVLNQPRKVGVEVPESESPAPDVSVSPLPGGGLVHTRLSF
jgi:hypothetical protein